MSMIVHQCATCGRREHDHDDTRSHPFDALPPVLVPTFDKRGEVERCIKPGDGLRAEASPIYEGREWTGEWERPGGILVKACDCDECRALYATLAGAA